MQINLKKWETGLDGWGPDLEHAELVTLASR